MLCVVFDVDDTLYLERDYVRSGFEAVGEWLRGHRGLHGFADRAWGRFEAGDRGDIFDRALVELTGAADRELVAQLVDVYRRHSPSIRLLPDADACMRELSERGARLAVITDGPAASQRAKVTALGLPIRCDPILVTAELGLGASKPNPVSFERVMQLASISGRSCAYVADNPAKDFKAPRSLGWTTVRVRRPGGLHAMAESGTDVDLEVPDLRGVPDLLATQGG